MNHFASRQFLIMKSTLNINSSDTSERDDDNNLTIRCDTPTILGGKPRFGFTFKILQKM